MTRGEDGGGLLHGPVPRYCPICGSTWEPDRLVCSHCTAHALARAKAVAEDRPGGRGITSAIWLYLVILFVNLGAVIAGVARTGELQFGLAYGIVAASLINILVIGGWMIGSWSRIRDALHPPVPLRWCFAAVGLACITYPIALLLSLPIDYLTDFAEEPDIIAPLLDAGFDWRFVVLIIAVHAGIFEELAFRGIIFGALRSVLHEREVILVSSLLFMVMHLNPTDFPYLLFLGLVLGVVRSRSKSLYPCMILHFSHNLIAVLLYFAPEEWFE